MAVLSPLHSCCSRLHAGHLIHEARQATPGFHVDHRFQRLRHPCAEGVHVSGSVQQSPHLLNALRAGGRPCVQLLCHLAVYEATSTTSPFLGFYVWPRVYHIVLISFLPPMWNENVRTGKK